MKIGALVLVPALIACAQLAQDEASQDRPAIQPPPSQAYLIRGEERAGGTPGWQAVIDHDRVLLGSPTSAGWYAVAAPASRREEDRRILSGGGLVLTIEPAACARPEFRHALPDRITLDWDGGRFEGCGGPRQPPRGILGTRWELVRIGEEGAPSSRSPAATLQVGEDGALGGTLACNNGGIRTVMTGTGFVPHGGGFEQTAMACNQPEAEAFGMRFWNGLIAARAWRRDGERLFITLADGSEAELRFLL